VFRDAFAVEYLNDREDYEQERINIVGMCDGTLLNVTYAERRKTSTNLGSEGSEK
jgi:hypothetical protein